MQSLVGHAILFVLQELESTDLAPFCVLDFHKSKLCGGYVAPAIAHAVAAFAFTALLCFCKQIAAE
eukprot:12640-Heterococcus_DN1.PRE.3